jgi:transcriptional regulator with XRE-family HTH domain
MAKKIKNLRHEKGLTLEQVADVVGVGKSTVRKWETGMIANMRRDKIADLAKALGTTPAYLMGWEDGENKAKKVSPYEELTEGEWMLIKMFRQIPEDQQKSFLEMGRVFANSLRKD